MRSAAVVGTGLIGTSIALALRGRGVTPYLIDRDPEAARTAAELGAGVVGAPRTPVDLAILAVPPQAVAETLRDQQAKGLAEDFTDVASVKALPLRGAAELGCDLSRYLGGHPMAGREQSGPLAARGDLFQGRPWVLTPAPGVRERTVERVRELIGLCGAEPVVMEHSQHDGAVALISHAPHVVASLVAARLLHGDESQLRLAGQGLLDVTRIAAGDAELWTDIIGSNATAVADVLAELTLDLGLVVDALRDLGSGAPERPRASRADLTTALARGVRGRDRIPARGPAALRLSGAAVAD
ncbi:prephenate dehydrogenase [Streptomyces sp. DT24]|uniref:prephenate dehydrogenase n=1 Tax=unclassified Streptomyces TaxID=2593676 RepID=UPI0023B8AEA1|nr:prephenate dehydrogenase [Streptomyces sp. AM 4-1-1]WEH32303.1 prephenate dehydrogenase [Streptomyces sp. AM 4-1-1]